MKDISAVCVFRRPAKRYEPTESLVRSELGLVNCQHQRVLLKQTLIHEELCAHEVRWLATDIQQLCSVANGEDLTSFAGVDDFDCEGQAICLVEAILRRSCVIESAADHEPVKAVQNSFIGQVCESELCQI